MTSVARLARSMPYGAIRKLPDAAAAAPLLQGLSAPTAQSRTAALDLAAQLDASGFVPATCRPLPPLPQSRLPARMLMSKSNSAAFVLSPPFRHGSFGEISYAVDSSGALFAAKEVLPGGPRPSPRPGEIKPTPLPEIQRELNVAQAVDARLKPVAVMAAKNRVVRH